MSNRLSLGTRNDFHLPSTAQHWLLWPLYGLFILAPTITMASDSYDFANSFLDSLSYIKQSTRDAGNGLRPKEEQSNSNDIKPLIDALNGLRLAENDLNYSTATLTVFALNNNADAAQSSTKTMLRCVADLNNDYEQIVSIYKDMYRNHSGASQSAFDPVEATDQISKINANIQKTMDTITLASIMATYALIEYPTKNGPGNLAMNDTQRTKLLDEIQKTFPSASGKTEDVKTIDAGAAAFYKVLKRFPVHK